MHPISILAHTTPVLKVVSASLQRGEIARPLPHGGDKAEQEETLDFASLFDEAAKNEDIAKPVVEGALEESESEAEPLIDERPEVRDRSDLAKADTSPHGAADRELFAMPEVQDEPIPVQADLPGYAANAATAQDETDATAALPTKSSKKESVAQVIAALAVDHRMTDEMRIGANRVGSTPMTEAVQSQTVAKIQTGSDPVMSQPQAAMTARLESAALGVPRAAKEPLRIGEVAGAQAPASAHPVARIAAEPQQSLPPTRNARLPENTLPDLPRVAGHLAPKQRQTAATVLIPASEAAPVPRAVSDTSRMALSDLPAELFTDTMRPSGTAPLAAHNRPELPGHVARQMAEAMQQAPNRPVELALNPVELGRVRMSISAEEGSIVVHVLAERAETLDLLRRNIDQLGEEFQSLGYASVAFSFGQGTADDGDFENRSDAKPHVMLQLDDVTDNPPLPNTPGTHRGVDIRL